MIDFRIYTFLEVCRTLNFTKAGQNLSVTQPAVSQHIRFLEEHYGYRLFDTRGKKIQLTPAGEILYHAASTMVHDEIHLQKLMEDSAHPAQTVTFGVTMTIGEYTLSPHLSSYIREHPGTAVRVVVANTHELLSMLSGQEIDFAIVEGYFSKSEYDSLQYSRENFIAVCSPDAPFASRSVSLEDLFSCNLIVRESGSGTREIFEKALTERNATVADFSNTIEINSMNAIKSLTAQNCGITFLYETAVKKELETGTLVRIPLRDFNISHDFTFIWTKGSIFSDYYHELFQQLK
ncbi:LysR family transcriptional regulator [Hespellia stercorisuis]|uniref:DNA-binding transcriptional regulator, LysR family n=1 Tax=Hespellia stercorisuis DSM 15480 TaxID=1121950 RepID=A0A1M6WDB3_9FIRM|nr:LysR substrate-binding domain-containing protein [Hespellia stercorisuis]SHK91644.1 DNA-binding transcriptional regulator, LysR family [Hespellia stercorisuis DSM 15480]